MTFVTAVGTRRPLRVPTAVRLRTGVGLAALVGALVVGILGMHVLANHGTPASVTAAPSAVTAATAASSTSTAGMNSRHDSAMASGASHDGHSRAAAVASSPAGAGHGSHDMTSMVMLCVVMLAAAALTLFGLLAVGVLRPLLPSAFAPASARERTLQWVRGTGPPPAWQFSVIRC